MLIQAEVQQLLMPIENWPGDLAVQRDLQKAVSVKLFQSLALAVAKQCQCVAIRLEKPATSKRLLMLSAGQGNR